MFITFSDQSTQNNQLEKIQYHPRFSAEILSKPLTHIINLSIEDGFFPNGPVQGF